MKVNHATCPCPALELNPEQLGILCKAPDWHSGVNRSLRPCAHSLGHYHPEGDKCISTPWTLFFYKKTLSWICFEICVHLISFLYVVFLEVVWCPQEKEDTEIAKKLHVRELCRWLTSIQTRGRERSLWSLWQSIWSTKASASCSTRSFCEPVGKHQVAPGSWRVTWVPDGEEERVLSSQGDPPEGDGKSDQSWLDTSVLGNPIRWLQRKPKRPNFCSLSRDGRHVGGSPWPQANSTEGWQASWKKKKARKKVSNSTWGVKKFYLLSRVFPFLTEV